MIQWEEKKLEGEQDRHESTEPAVSCVLIGCEARKHVFVGLRHILNRQIPSFLGHHYGGVKERERENGAERRNAIESETESSSETLRARAAARLRLKISGSHPELAKACSNPGTKQLAKPSTIPNRLLKHNLNDREFYQIGTPSKVFISDTRSYGQNFEIALQTPSLPYTRL